MNTKKLKQTTMAVILTATAVAFAGCGGSGSSGNSQKAAGKAADSLNTIDQALGQALSGGEAAGLVLQNETKGESVSASVSCEPSGSVSVSGDVNEGETSGDFDLDFTFNGCEGINGSLDIFGNYTETRLTATIDGSVEDSECQVVFSKLTFDVTAGEVSALEVDDEDDFEDDSDDEDELDDDSDGDEEDAAEADDEEDEDDAGISENVTITGSVSVTCGGETFSCGQEGDEITCNGEEADPEEEGEEENGSWTNNGSIGENAGETQRSDDVCCGMGCPEDSSNEGCR